MPRGPAPDLPREGQQAFDSWLNWREQVKLEPLHMEQRVYSLHHGFAGQMDLYAAVDGKLTVLDWKSGKAIYDEAYLQSAAYWTAFREMGHGADDMQGCIVRLPKTAGDSFEVAVIPAPWVDRLFRVFLGILESWKLSHIGVEKYAQNGCGDRLTAQAPSLTGQEG